MPWPRLIATTAARCTDMDIVDESASHSMRSVSPDWQRYAEEKQRWLDTHLNATPEEYDEAMKAIAKDCGV